MSAQIIGSWNLESWCVQESQVAPYKIYIAEEKLKIDRSTLKSIKNAIRVSSKEEDIFVSQRLPLSELEKIEFIFVDDESYPFSIEKDRWIVNDSSSSVVQFDVLKEDIRLRLESKAFLKNCIRKSSFKWSERLTDSPTKLEAVYLLYECGDIHVNEGLQNCLKKIPVDDSWCFDLEELFVENDNWFKLPVIGSSIQAINNYLKNEPDYLISETIEPLIEELKLPIWKSQDWRADEMMSLDFFLEEIDINSGKYFLPIERIHEEASLEPDNSQKLLPSWNLSRLNLASMQWGIFKGLRIEQLNDEQSFLPEESTTMTEWSPPVSNHTVTCSDYEISPKNQVEFSKIENIPETPPDSTEIVHANTSVHSSASMETCKGDTIQEITKAPEFPDSVFLNPAKRNFEQIEETSLEVLIKSVKKKKKRTSNAVIETNERFPINSVLEFTQYITPPKTDLKTVLEEGETVAQSSEAPPFSSTDSFTIIGQKSIVMNISLYKKDRVLFDLIQELRKTGHLQVQEQELPFTDKDFDIFLSPSTGIFTVPSKQINQFDIFTGRRLVVEQLMSIAHQCTDIIVIIINMQTSSKIDGLEDFVNVMKLNKIKTTIVTLEDYLYKVCELINEKARELPDFENEEKSAEEIFLQECDIWNPLLVKEILSRDSLENFISMGDELRVLKYKDIMTYEMLESFNEIIINEFAT